MASNFPTSIDTFTNPVYTKINGEDVVSASHINDLQDAVRAVQEVLCGAGKTLDLSSNNFVADDSSFRAMVVALDDAAGQLSNSFIEHKNYVIVTDPSQHHANVIEVTPIANLSSTRVQVALQEHQADIDAIMSGNTVEGITLDNRYVKKTAAQSMQGPLTVTTDLIINGNATLGNALGDLVTIAGDLTIAGDTILAGETQISGDLLIAVGQKIAEDGAVNSSYILFGSDKLELYSHKDIILRLDADDATDGLSQAGQFLISNGLNSTVFSVNESGATVAGSLSCSDLTTTGTVSSGNMIVSDTKLDIASQNMQIQLDKNNVSGTARFFVTMNGDTGSNLASANMLMNIDENSVLTTGIHKLKSGVQETGYFGLRVLSTNAGGVFFGAGVNFKHQLTNSPSSITLTPRAGSTNYSNLSVVDITQHGFFFEFDTPATGPAKILGTYTTIGN
jgi:hypothetical protein